MIYDITSVKNACDFIEKFFCMDAKSLKESFGDNYEENKDEFIESQIDNLINWDIINTEFAIIHVTSNKDNCEEIKEKGIVNLQRALTEDTELYRFLQCYDIKFNIENATMTVGDDQYNINYDYYRNLNRYGLEKEKKKLKDISRKIYSDYQINGFLFTEDVKRYGTYIHERPEFIYNIDNFLMNGDKLSKEWAKAYLGYKIKFKTKIESFKWYSFYENEDDFKEDNENNFTELKKKLISLAMDVSFSEISRDIYVYMNDEVKICGNQFLEYERII